MGAGAGVGKAVERPVNERAHVITLLGQLNLERDELYSLDKL